jgi:outer membrane protein TolC
METEAASRVAAQEQSAADARDALAVLIGRAPEATLTLAAAADSVPLGEPFPASLEALVAHALSTRPEIADARDRISDARRAADVARWNLLPPVSLDASFTRRGIGMPDGAAFNALVGGWHVAINTAYGLDRSTERAAAATVELQIGDAQRNARTVEQQIAMDVRRLSRAWTSARAAVTLREQALGLARRQREIAMLRLERGLATSLDVLDAESTVLNAETALAGARLDRLIDEISLRRAAGLLTIGGA